MRPRPSSCHDPVAPVHALGTGQAQADQTGYVPGEAGVQAERGALLVGGGGQQYGKGWDNIQKEGGGWKGYLTILRGVITSSRMSAKDQELVTSAQVQGGEIKERSDSEKAVGYLVQFNSLA